MSERETSSIRPQIDTITPLKYLETRRQLVRFLDIPISRIDSWQELDTSIHQLTANFTAMVIAEGALTDREFLTDKILETRTEWSINRPIGIKNKTQKLYIRVSDAEVYLERYTKNFLSKDGRRSLTTVLLPLVPLDTTSDASGVVQYEDYYYSKTIFGKPEIYSVDTTSTREIKEEFVKILKDFCASILVSSPASLTHRIIDGEE